MILIFNQIQIKELIVLVDVVNDKFIKIVFFIASMKNCNEFKHI